MPALPTAVLVNPLSGSVRRRLGRVRAVARRIAGDRYVETSDPGRMDAFVAEHAPGEDGVLCVAGGDGSVHAVLTALERHRPQGAWPALAAAPGGTTNLTVKDMGRPGPLLAYLEALEAWAREGGRADDGQAPSAGGGPAGTPAGDALAAHPPSSGPRFVPRPVMRVAQGGAEPLVGMIFAGGAAPAGVEFFHRRLRPLGIPEVVGSPLAFVRMLAAIVRGGPALERMTPVVTAHVNGHPPLTLPTLLVMASPLHRHVIGSRPYWGKEEGPLHVTLAHRDVKGLVRHYPDYSRGDPRGVLRPEEGWHSHNTDRLLLRFDGPYIVDGELFHARADDGPLELTAPRTVRWWMPGR